MSTRLRPMTKLIIAVTGIVVAFAVESLLLNLYLVSVGHLELWHQTGVGICRICRRS